MTSPRSPGPEDETITITGHSAPAAETRAGAEQAPPPLRAIGRFLVLDTLGEGGMGVVMSAYDPVLERKVAIKLLRADRSFEEGTRGRAQLVSEAQALARLSHPNVVAIHEIAFSEGSAALVMDLIPGITLRTWLGERERPWPEVLARFLGAAEGLAAAHREGIVHRDFKPDNVLIDRDGRARIVDFGLAAMVSEGGGSRSRGPMGTRAYMAPEQLRNEPCDARVNQFAFSVALWEALHGNRPFNGRAPDELCAAIAAGPVEPLRKTPDWVRAALARGMAADREARWPSLDDLVRALRRDPRVIRRRVAVGAALVAVLAGALWLAWPSAEAIDPCAGAAGRLAGVWDGPRAMQLHAVFVASRLAYAPDSWRAVQDRLDRYAAGWVAMAGEACRATRVDGRQSDTLMDLRMGCLEQRRSVLGALTGLWARGMNADAIEHATEAADGLASLAECADTRALSERTPLPTSPAQVAQIATTRGHLDEVSALTLAHRLPDARKAAASVRAEADATGWPDLRAQAAFALGDVLGALADPSAEASLVDAGRLAGEARDDRLAARALNRLVGVIAIDQQNAARALAVADAAEVMVARAADDGLRIDLLRNRGRALVTEGKAAAAKQILDAARTRAVATFGAGARETLGIVAQLVSVERDLGNYAAARKLGEENLAATVAALGPDHPQVVTILNSLASIVADGGDPEAAAAYLRRAVAIDERVAGPDSATTAIALNNLGIVERTRGHFDEAVALFERAIAIRERVLGPDAPYLASSLSGLGEVRMHQGRFPEALALMQRALAIQTKAYGPQHARTALGYHKIGEVYEAQGDAAGALDNYQRSLDIRKKVLGPSHGMTMYSMMLVSSALAKLHRCGEAQPLLAIAEPGLAKAFNPEHPDVTAAMVIEAECDLQAGRAAAAIDRLERVLAIDGKTQVRAVQIGEHRGLLAQALWAAGRRDLAVAAARKAETELTGAPSASPEVAELQRWLAAHH